MRSWSCNLCNLPLLWCKPQMLPWPISFVFVFVFEFVFLFLFDFVFVFVFHLCNLPLWGNVYKQSASLAYFHIYRNPFSQTFFQSSIQNSDFPIFRTLFSFCYGTIYKYYPCVSVLSCLRYMRKRRNLTALQVGEE